jgi:beta-glucosidase
MEKVFPQPNNSGMRAGIHSLRQMLRCHAAAYHTIKDKYPDAPVGVAKNFPIIEPRLDGNRLDHWWASRISRMFNDFWLDALQDGRIRWPFGRGKIKNLAGSFDFVGINYYTRFYVKFPPGKDVIDKQWGPDALVSDGNYGEVYPYGLYRAIKHVLRYKKPIFITENGLPDARDKQRPAFIMDHLRQIWQAISFCYPVMGYYHWSLVDNFEWDRGWTQRFGLIALDPDTQERTWRTSGRLYSEICSSYKVSSDMAQRYAPQMMPVMFPGDPVSVAESQDL